MIKNHTLSLLFYLRKKNLNEKGEAPIYLRISVDGQRSAVTLNRYINETKWSSGGGGRAKGNKEDIKELNNYLDSVKSSILAHQRDLLDRNKPITAESLRNAFLGLNDKKHTLLELFGYHNAEMEQKVGKDFAAGTLTRYATTYSHIKAFIKEKYRMSDFQLTELNFKFITDLEHWFKTVRNCNHNSSLKYIRNLRKIVNIAVANDWLDKDPFLKYKSKLEDTKRTFLSAEELKAIEETEISIHRVEVVRDIFVFACYTGLAYADMVKLTSNNLRKGIDREKWIYTQRTKTGNNSNIPLLPPAIAILDKYKNNPECISSGKLLPISSNQRMNSYLKDVATTCKVNKELTFHMARHTFATTVTLTNGVPIESVSTMLGHKSIRTTQIYAKVVERKVSEDMASLKTKMFNTAAALKISTQ